MFPPSIQNLLNEFQKFPGIGPKTAERFVFYLLKQPRQEIKNFLQAVANLVTKTTTCAICQNYAEKSPCAICSNPRRDKTVICVVSRPQDIAILEKTGEYHGVYHLLGGLYNPLENKTSDQLKVRELLERIENSAKTQPIKEVVLALDPTVEGETTILYLAKLLKPLSVKITRLARGLPMGADLEYADEVTLTNALKGRREV